VYVILSDLSKESLFTKELNSPLELPTLYYRLIEFRALRGHNMKAATSPNVALFHDTMC